MPSDSIKAEFYMCMQKVLIFGKKSVHQLDSNPRPPQLLYPLSHIAMAVVFDGMLLEFSPLLCLAECNLVTAFTHGDKLEVGAVGCWVYDIRQLPADVSSPREVISLTERQLYRLQVFF